MRLLIVEDDQKIAAFLRKGLEAAGFAVDHASNGEDGLHLAQENSYEVAIVDLMLPKLNGLALIDALRAAKIYTPVLILSARRSIDDRVLGLERGGDDYLTKPFAFSELLARVRVLMRRPGETVEVSTLRFADLVVDTVRHHAERAGQILDLRPREFALLEFLLRSAERVVSKSQIMEAVWNDDFVSDSDVVEVLVCRLRRKVDRDFEPALIHTIRGVGYVLKADR